MPFPFPPGQFPQPIPERFTTAPGFVPPVLSPRLIAQGGVSTGLAGGVAITTRNLTIPTFTADDSTVILVCITAIHPETFTLVTPGFIALPVVGTQTTIFYKQWATQADSGSTFTVTYSASTRDACSVRVYSHAQVDLLATTGASDGGSKSIGFNATTLHAPVSTVVAFACKPASASSVWNNVGTVSQPDGTYGRWQRDQSSVNGQTNPSNDSWDKYNVPAGAYTVPTCVDTDAVAHIAYTVVLTQGYAQQGIPSMLLAPVGPAAFGLGLPPGNTVVPPPSNPAIGPPQQASARGRIPALARRARSTQPIPAPITVVITPLPPQPGRRLGRWPILHRGRSFEPAWAAYHVQVLPPQQPPSRDRPLFMPRRARSTQPVLAQVVVVTAQALPPQQPPSKDRPLFKPRRAFVTTPPPVTVTVVQQPVRRPSRPLLGRRGKTTQPVAVTVVVTAQALPPQPARGLARFRPGSVKRGRSTTVPTTVVVTTTQALPPQPARGLARFRPGAVKRARTATAYPTTAVVVLTPGTIDAGSVPSVTITDGAQPEADATYGTVASVAITYATTAGATITVGIVPSVQISTVLIPSTVFVFGLGPFGYGPFGG